MNISIILPSKNEHRILETIEACEQLNIADKIIIVNDRYGNGKGWAVREGIREATGDVICLLDADLDIHPREIMKLLPYIECYDIVVGMKRIEGLFLRRLVTCLSRIYIKLLFGVKVNTQTGIKLFRRYALSDFKTNGYGYDIEVLAKAEKAGYLIKEIPINAYITKQVSSIAIVKTFFESIKIYRSLCG